MELEKNMKEKFIDEGLAELKSLLVKEMTIIDYTESGILDVLSSLKDLARDIIEAHSKGLCACAAVEVYTHPPTAISEKDVSKCKKKYKIKWSEYKEIIEEV
jgi:hypothetical protein